MPIILKDKSYTDIYGNTTTYFKANAGDTISVKYTLNTEIFTRSTMTNIWNIEDIERQITQSQGSFLNEGFRVGQTYVIKEVGNTNSVFKTFTGTILEVGDLYIKMTGLPSLNNWNTSGGSILCLFVEQKRQSLELGINFVDNSIQSPSLSSFIDGETNRFVVNGLNSVSVGSSVPLTQVGKKSGGFSVSNAQIKRIADTSNPYVIFTHNQENWEVTFDVIFPAMFSEDSFVGQECLKLYSKLDFKVNQGETFGVTTIDIKDSADTGFFDTGFNTEAPNVISTTSDANELFYNKPNTITFDIVANDITINDIEIGAMYYSLDDYNKNKPLSQENYLPFAKSGLWNVSDVGSGIVSSVYPFNLSLSALSITNVGSERTFSGEIILNPFYTSPTAFGKFIEGRGDSDRLMYIWVKVGNTNTLLFSGQMTYEMPVGVLITPDLSIIVNHDQNIDFSNLSTPTNNSDFNIEDDLGYITDFTIYEADDNQSVICKVVATDGTDEFDLETITFDLSNQDLNNFINASLSVSNNLSTTSKKKSAYLIEKTALSGGAMDLRLYFPFLIHWESWITQLNATTFFKKNSIDTKNWFNYQTGSWDVKLKVEVNRNGVADYFYQDFTFKNYDDSIITSQIKIYDYDTMTQVSSLKTGKMMLIEVTHDFSVNYSGFPYAQITIEPSQSSPRYVLSTEMDADKSNPLKGITYTPRLDMTFTSPTIITLTCLLDMSKLQGTNYCISSKISEEGTNNNFIEYDKLMEDGTPKFTEDLLTKITE